MWSFGWLGKSGLFSSWLRFGSVTAPLGGCSLAKASPRAKNPRSEWPHNFLKCSKRQSARSLKNTCRLLTLLLVVAGAKSFCQTNTVERPLSLSQCFRLALEHNFDVKIARFNPEIQQHNLNAAYGAYEPDSTFAAARNFSAAPVALNTLGEPVTGPTSYGDTFSPGINGILPTGLGYNLGGNLFGITETAPGAAPASANAATSLQLLQPLLRNSWIDGPREAIQINKKLLKISKLTVTQQIMTTLTSVELA